jgi:DNA adenine methylase
MDMSMLPLANTLQEIIHVPHRSDPSIAVNPKPFLKWPGGKRWLAERLAKMISENLTHRYYEPFLGGGAVFFSLMPLNATLSDINGDLINVYVQVRDNPDELLIGLKKLAVSKENYYVIRNYKPEDNVEKAIKFLYLNRTAFAGLYRLNSKGEFNVPYGGGNRTPEPLWKKNLITIASICLEGVELIISDFGKILDAAGVGDVVYCDPTYTTSHNNNGFTRYNEKNFSWFDQERLAAKSINACKRGAYVIISNASYAPLCDLYYPFSPLELTRKSLVSRKVEARLGIKEYLFILDPNENL